MHVQSDLTNFLIAMLPRWPHHVESSQSVGCIQPYCFEQTAITHFENQFIRANSSIAPD